MNKRKDLIFVKELLTEEIPLKFQKILAQKIYDRINEKIEKAGKEKDQKNKYEKKQNVLMNQREPDLTKMLDCILELGGDGSKQDIIVENQQAPEF